MIDLEKLRIKAMAGNVASGEVLDLLDMLDSAQKDEARLDFVEKNCSGKVFRPYTANTDYVKFEWNNDDGDMREAIDAAMKS